MESFVSNCIILVHISALLILINVNAQHWWNFDSNQNPYKPPPFNPSPDGRINYRYTHKPEINKYGPMPNDVIVNIPKAGLGQFIGFSIPINYGHTPDQWPPLQENLVNVFLGIPYAAPPIDGLRFRLPKPSYLDTRYPWYAKSFRPACMQPSGWFNHTMSKFDMSEDCLYLNIYFPNRTWEDPTTRYPVIFHIHGGSFIYGSSHTYPGLALATKGVVVVTINYRLGPLGFLSTGDFASVGNYGLWDQQMALSWVKNNIAWFRGDPDRITLMGESAGAASVGFHLVSPASAERYLFHQAIMISGADLSHWALSDPEEVRTRYYATQLAINVNCSSVQHPNIIRSQAEMSGPEWFLNDESVPPGQFGNSSVTQRIGLPYSVQIDAHQILFCLRYETTAQQIVDAAANIATLRGAPTFIWTPVVDGTSGFLPRSPIKERKIGRFADVPLLSGVVRDEGSQVLIHYLNNQKFAVENFTDDVVRRLIGDILNNRNVLRFNETAEELYTRYTWWPNLENNTARWLRLAALFSDMEITAALDSVVKYHANRSGSTYFYEFSYLSPNDSQSSPEKGIYHGAELPFLFGYPFMNKSTWQALFGDVPLPSCANSEFSYPQDMNMSDFIIELWTNFVKYGNPTPYPVKNITWPQFKRPQEPYLLIRLNSSIGYHYRTSDLAFWQHRFLGLAETIMASPYLYYFPLIDVRLATIILAIILGLALIALVILIILLSQRPSPKKFSRSVRLAMPGVGPGTEFQTAFKDSFASRTIYHSFQTNLTSYATPTYTNEQSPITGTFKLESHRLSYLPQQQSQMQEIVVHSHPPAPSIPQTDRILNKKRNRGTLTHLSELTEDKSPLKMNQSHCQSSKPTLHKPYYTDV